MKVKILEELEDANVFFRDEDDFELAMRDGETKYKPQQMTMGGEFVGVRRVDILHAGETYDLPSKQAQNLIELEKAENA